MFTVALEPVWPERAGRDSFCCSDGAIRDPGAPVSISHHVRFVPLIDTGTNRCRPELKIAWAAEKFCWALANWPSDPIQIPTAKPAAKRSRIGSTICQTGRRRSNQNTVAEPEVANSRSKILSGEAATQDSLGLSPRSVNLRGLGLYAEDLSRRDSVKVAQYEVLGNGANRRVRPGRDDRNAWLLVSHAAQRLPVLVDRPVRDGHLFKNANPALRTVLLS